MAKTEAKQRSNNFMERPASGWLHDDTALAAGDEGIFYSFPVFYAGSIQLKESLRGLDMNEQTDLTRELMAIVAEAAGIRKASDRVANAGLRKKFARFLNGTITVGQVEVSFCISANALAIGPPKELRKTSTMTTFFAIHDMKTVSLAAGGELRDYDLVAYVAKDNEGNRECYVFDCGEMADEVLTTIGQGFVIAQQSAHKARQAGKLDTLLAKAETVLAPEEVKLKPTPKAAAKKPEDKKQKIIDGLNKIDKERRENPSRLPQAPIQQKPLKELTPTELEELHLREAEQADKNRPSWVCWSNADTINRISLDELRKQFLSQAATQEVIEVEEED